LRAIRALALCWPLLGGCAWITQHNATSAKLEREYEMAQLRAADLEAQVAQATTRIEQLEATVREQGQSQAARLETIDQVNDEIARLRGQIESLQFSVDEMKSALEADRTQRELRMLYTERRLDALERLMKVKPPPMPTINELSGTAPVTDPTTPPPTRRRSSPTRPPKRRSTGPSST
jgi:hypothetical protein